MTIAIILLCLGALTSTVFIVSKVINYSPKTIVFKTIASLVFVALGIYGAVVTPGPTPIKVFIVLGLFFGTLGDLLLGFKYVVTKNKNIWILAGMFAFAFGHVFYVIALFVGYYVPGNPWFIALPFLTAVVISSLYMVISRKAGVRFGKLLPFGLFYLFCLTSMVSSSLYMNVLHGFTLTNLVMFFAGAVCFSVSDCMLTGAYFKAGKRSNTYMATYSAFYYVAQFVIAFSLMFLG